MRDQVPNTFMYVGGDPSSADSFECELGAKPSTPVGDNA